MFDLVKYFDPSFTAFDFPTSLINNRNLKPSFGEMVCQEVDDKLIMTIDLPGVKHENLDVTYKEIDNSIQIESTRQENKKTLMYKVSHRYDATSAKAHLELGVLSITFEQSKSKVLPQVGSVT